MHQNFWLIDSQEDVKPDGVESAWPELSSNERCKARLIDSDGDGMPDEWEIRHGLDPQNPDDRNKISADDDYTMLEVYLNDLIK